MDFNVEKNSFYKALSKIQIVAEKKTTSPILANTLIKGENNNLKLFSTNLEIGIKLQIEANIITPGEICIPSQKIFEIVRELFSDEIHIESMDNFWVKVVSGRSLFQLAGIDPVEYPVETDISNVKFFDIDKKLFMEMIDKTAFASSNEESRFNLNGISVSVNNENDKKNLLMVATDGHRLALIEREIQTDLEIEDKIIVPKKGFIELRKIFHDSGDTIKVGLTQKELIIKMDDDLITIRLLEGEYPNYQRVIPTDNDKSFIVKKDDLIRALRRVSIMISDRDEGIIFSIKEGELILHTNSGSNEIGFAKDILDIEFTGEPLDIAFNARYLIEALQTIDSEKIIFELKDGESAGLVKGENEEKHLNIIMPMRI
ncbi:MAG: DNA polymerase III subunit beta [Deltaproteobacteria bacterium]|nr:DNA polymerase III subunit beta [Deltaproteobacteria bacterium]RLA91380.1 MAG: DNA polymerase III subunit beta [Deltaproteobacteria bacterium]